MAEESLQLREASNQLRLATQDLRAFNQSAGVEIAKTVGNDLKKGVLDPFTQSFAQIPGVSTLGSVGKTLFNKTFAAIKERREQNLLRQQLGLSKERFAQLQKQNKVLKAQENFSKKIQEGAENLLGLDTEKFNFAARRFLQPDSPLFAKFDDFAKGQQELIDKQDKHILHLKGSTFTRWTDDSVKTSDPMYKKYIDKII